MNGLYTFAHKSKIQQETFKMENKNITNEKKSGNNKLWLILFLIAVILNIYQWMDKSSTVERYEVRTDSLTTITVNLDKELDETYAELNQYKGTSERLDSLLQEANEQIDQQKARIEKLMRNEKNLSVRNKKLAAELEELQRLKNEYLEKIDQLLIENQNLKRANEELTQKNAEVSQNLESTVNQASVLRSEYLISKAYKKRSNSKYVETALAKRTNKLEVCFALLDNAIAKAGEKRVYLRIVEPGGKTLGNTAEGSATFTVPASGEVVQYTSMETITYTNSRQDLCLNWADNERNYPAGTYVIEIYVDGTLSASSTHTLK